MVMGWDGCGRMGGVQWGNGMGCGCVGMRWDGMGLDGIRMEMDAELLYDPDLSAQRRGKR